ncbi:hypothetical protein [Enterocloster sp.]
MPGMTEFGEICKLIIDTIDSVLDIDLWDELLYESRCPHAFRYFPG